MLYYNRGEFISIIIFYRRIKMKEYTDETKKWRLRNLIHSKDLFDYTTLSTLQADDILEDYDLFRIKSDHFDNMFMYFFDGGFYMIKRDRKTIGLIDQKLLQDRLFSMGNRSITNNAQGFLQRKGRKAFDKLSGKELIDVILYGYVQDYDDR